MKASTHTEVYRPFTGQISKHPRRALVLARAAVRVNFKRKLPLLLMFVPLGIACIIMCFKVHFGFAMAAAQTAADGGSSPQAMFASAQIQAILGSTVQNIFSYIQGSSYFVLILMTWYGSGLISEDKRLGANLLYFSRPLSRADYILGKFMAASWAGVLGLLVPCLCICITASFSSPEWSFLREEWQTFPKVFAFGALWITTVALVVLTVSSLTNRRTHALVGAIGLVYGAMITTKMMAAVLRERRVTVLDLFANMERIGEWLFDVTLVRDRGVSPEASLAALAGLWVLCLFLLTERVRRLEVVA